MAIISKKKLNELLALSNEPTIDLLEDTKKSYKIEINGDKDKVKKSSFENRMLEFMSNMNEFVEKQNTFNNKVINFMSNMNEFVEKQNIFNNNVLNFMSNMDNFVEKQNIFNNNVLDFIKEQKEFNNEVKNDIKDIKSRLDTLESFHKDDFEQLKSKN